MRAVWCRRSGTVSVLAALMVGCGGESSGSISLDQLGTEYAAMFCRKAFSCCDDTERSGIPSGDEASCRSSYGTSFNAGYANLQMSVDAGRTRYHGDRARRCLDTMAALPCPLWGIGEAVNRLSDCNTTFEGQVAPGGTCARDQECASGYCETSTGTCVARPKQGEPCTEARCELGLACLNDAWGGAACGASRPDGSACYVGAECASFCDANVCGPSVLCDGV
jgi:hypothetical protein